MTAKKTTTTTTAAIKKAKAGKTPAVEAKSKAKEKKLSALAAAAISWNWFVGGSDSTSQLVSSSMTWAGRFSRLRWRLWALYRRSASRLRPTISP